MSRDVPYSGDDICDRCGAVGAYDFIGDCLCSMCAEEALGEPVACNRCGHNPCECGL